jgi:hypothetical protein
MKILILLCSVLFFGSVAVGQAGDPSSSASNTASDIVLRLTENNRRRQLDLQAYTGQRTYHLLYTGFPGRREAEMVVNVTYEAPGTKTFTITSQTGSGWIVNRVFKKLLATEKEAADSKAQASSALTNDNYGFQLLGRDLVDGRPAYVLQVEPKIDNKLLYRGKIWVDEADFAVAKIEAEPAKRPSMWINKTLVRHTYEKIGAFWLPLQNQSTTEVVLGGQATLSIQYSDYKVLSQADRPNSQARQLLRPSAVKGQVVDALGFPQPFTPGTNGKSDDFADPPSQ